jgi:spermidine/putrescine-binding protein
VVHRARILRLWLITGTASVPLALFAAGCGDSSSGGSTSEATVSTAEVRSASGQVEVAGWQYYQDPEVQDAGAVSSKWSYLSTGPDIITKARSGEFDVVDSETSAMAALKTLDVVAPIDTSLLSNYDSIEAGLRASETWKQEGKVIGVPFSVTPSMTSFDTSEVQEPKTLDDLLKPEFADGIAIYDDPAVIGGIAMAQGVEDTTKMTHEQLEKVMGFLEEMHPNVKTFYQFGEEIPLYARGDIVASIGSFGSVLAKEIEADPAVEFNFLGEITYTNGWVAPDGADMPAALNWIDRTLTPAGQKSIVENAGDYPAVPAARKYLEALDDPVSEELSRYTLPEVLEMAPELHGYAAEGHGDIVSIDEVTRAWDEYKASF